VDVPFIVRTMWTQSFLVIWLIRDRRIDYTGNNRLIHANAVAVISCTMLYDAFGPERHGLPGSQLSRDVRYLKIVYSKYRDISNCGISCSNRF